MNRINYGRVLAGGLLAGLVLAIGEFLLNELVIAERWLEALETLGVEPPTLWIMIVYVVMVFVLGIAIVWLYAAIRPRFGPGPSTASLTGLIVWFLIWLWSFGGAAIWGFFQGDLVLIIVLWGLVEVVLAALAGGWLYQEAAEAGNTVSGV
jgi:hypothetical protein